MYEVKKSNYHGKALDHIHVYKSIFIRMALTPFQNTVDFKNRMVLKCIANLSTIHRQLNGQNKRKRYSLCSSNFTEFGQSYLIHSHTVTDYSNFDLSISYTTVRSLF